MNRYYLNPAVKAQFPKRADNRIIIDILSNFTMGVITNCTFSNAGNTICFDNAQAVFEENMDFTINIENGGICICAKDYPCLINGFTTMLELIKYDEDNKQYLPIGVYSDKSNMKFRSVHLCIFPETKLEYLKKCIRSCAFAKYTHVVLEFWGMFKYDCLKELSWPFAYDKETIANLASEINALGMEIIPMFNHLGHASGCRIMHGKHVVLDQNPKYEYMFKNYGWEWNYSKPEVYDILAKVRDELIEVCGEGSYFHLGCDEAYAACLDAESVAEMTQYINRISHELMAKGRRAIMWGDMLLCIDDVSKMDGTYYANSKREVADYLVNNLSKDIIIADWEYEAYDDVWKTTEILNSYGFTMLCCPWNSEENIVSAIKTVNTLGVMGIMETTWHTLIQIFPLMVFGGYYAYSYGNENALHPLYKHTLAKDTFRCHAATIARKVSPSGGEYLRAGWAEESVGAGL